MRTAAASLALPVFLLALPITAAAQPQPGQAQPGQAQPAGNVLVDGALAVPGAPATDTVPAKFSPKNAAHDRLVIVAYTFKLLTADQRRAVYQALLDQPRAAVQAEIGTELPYEVSLRRVPDDLVARVPDTKGHEYVVVSGRASSERAPGAQASQPQEATAAPALVLLVSPPTRIVVGVFSALD